MRISWSAAWRFYPFARSPKRRPRRMRQANWMFPPAKVAWQNSPTNCIAAVSFSNGRLESLWNGQSQIYRSGEDRIAALTLFEGLLFYLPESLQLSKSDSEHDRKNNKADSLAPNVISVVAHRARTEHQAPYNLSHLNAIRTIQMIIEEKMQILCITASVFPEMERRWLCIWKISTYFLRRRCEATQYMVLWDQRRKTWIKVRTFCTALCTSRWRKHWHQ